MRILGHLRVFRYEIRRWLGGVVPDIGATVATVEVTDDEAIARRVLDAVASVPTPTWGRDELHLGEMWTCNSAIAWVLSSAGIDLDDVPLPDHGRAPGWSAGRVGTFGPASLTPAVPTVDREPLRRHPPRKECHDGPARPVAR